MNPLKGLRTSPALSGRSGSNVGQHLFDYILKKDGRNALRGTSGAIGIGDIALSAKALLREEGELAPAIAGRFALKLPTGDEDRALGSGEVDVGLGIGPRKNVRAGASLFQYRLDDPHRQSLLGHRHR